LALVLAGTACMTERDLLTQRIQSRIELFQTYPPATQVRLRNGHVEIGDTRDMVWIALGEPDRKLQRRTASGTNEVWSYTATDTRTVTVPGEAHGYRYGSRHGRYYGSDTVWVDTTQTLEYERLRVEFDGSAVVAVETLSPPVH
jgi:hypothetical protein